MRATLAIAYRLATQDLFTSGPRVLVLDEPTEGLDAIRRDALRDVLAAWRASGQPGQFVVVTHDRRLAGVCDKVIDLDRG
jgi:ATPase subunit of ABC transporter with duplicated ATPase domains